MGNKKNSDTLKQDIINTGSELSDKIAKDNGYKGEGAGKALAKDLYNVGVISKGTRDDLNRGVDQRNDLAHPCGKQRTDVNTNISSSDASKFSNAVNEVANKLAGDIDIKF